MLAWPLNWIKSFLENRLRNKFKRLILLDVSHFLNLLFHQDFRAADVCARWHEQSTTKTKVKPHEILRFMPNERLSLHSRSHKAPLEWIEPHECLYESSWTRMRQTQAIIPYQMLGSQLTVYGLVFEHARVSVTHIVAIWLQLIHYTSPFIPVNAVSHTGIQHRTRSNAGEIGNSARINQDQSIGSNTFAS